MTKTQFRVIIQTTFERLKILTGSKGEEYARDDDQLANFKRGAVDAGVTPQQVWVVFFNKHLDAIKYYCKHGRVLSESLNERIDDAILYLLLLKAIHNEYQEQQRLGEGLQEALHNATQREKLLNSVARGLNDE